MAGSSALEDGAAAQFDIKRSAAAMAGCPVSGAAAEYTPFDRPFIDDPYPFFARAEGRAGLLQPRDRLLGGDALRGCARYIPRPRNVERRDYAQRGNTDVPASPATAS